MYFTKISVFYFCRLYFLFFVISFKSYGTWGFCAPSLTCWIIYLLLSVLSVECLILHFSGGVCILFYELEWISAFNFILMYSKRKSGWSGCFLLLLLLLLTVEWGESFDTFLSSKNRTTTLIFYHFRVTSLFLMYI